MDKKDDEKKINKREKTSSRLFDFFLAKCFGPTLEHFPTIFRTTETEDNFLPGFDFFIDGVLLSLSFISILTVFTLDEVTSGIQISTVLFSISIPSLAFSYATYITARKFTGRKVIINASRLLERVGQVSAILGFILVLFNISTFAGIVFLITSALGLIFIGLLLVIVINDDELLKKFKVQESMSPESYQSMLNVRKLFPVLLDIMESKGKEIGKEDNEDDDMYK